MYLYVDKRDGLAKVPEPLLTRFGPAKEFMTLLLREERSLARVDVNKVMQSITESGFFLQMPAGKESYIVDCLPEYKV